MQTVQAHPKCVETPVIPPNALLIWLKNKLLQKY